MQVGNIFESITKNREQEVFDRLLQNEKLTIERIVSNGQVSPASGWYDQALDEWVLLLKGGAVITFEDKSEVRLRSGDYLAIPAHRKHKVSWTDPSVDTVWLAIHY